MFVVRCYVYFQNGTVIAHNELYFDYLLNQVNKIIFIVKFAICLFFLFFF